MRKKGYTQEEVSSYLVYLYNTLTTEFGYYHEQEIMVSLRDIIYGDSKKTYRWEEKVREIMKPNYYINATYMTIDQYLRDKKLVNLGI